MRSADAGLLSLALMDARTRTLAWLSVFDGLQFSGRSDHIDPPLWTIGHVAWYQEYWTTRHVQRGRGLTATSTAMRLPSIETRSDAWFSHLANSHRERWMLQMPEPDALRAYLHTSLEATLELLDKAEATDNALHFFRQALHHEDLMADALAVAAQSLNLSTERQSQAQALGLTTAWSSPVPRPAIGLPGQAVTLGAITGGWVPDTERGLLETEVLEFEIDAQAVGWSEYLEFIDDGGYDDPHWWTPTGWDWAQAQSRRSPRHVAQLSGGVLVQRQGRLQRVPSAQPVLHVTAFEADAWCRWAGRRLPSEAEWSLAARDAAARGWAWGEVLEWVAGTARPYPGGLAPGSGAQRVLRGAHRQSSPRLRHRSARRYALADADEGFFGFRSCVL